MPDARFVRDWDQTQFLLAGSAGIGDIWQMADGRAGYLDKTVAKSSGDRTEFKTSGFATVTKTTGIVLIDGGPVYWDYSANAATFRQVNDRDFFIGSVNGDAGSGDATCVVNLNVKPRYLVDLARDPYISAIIGTQAIGAMGIIRNGGALNFHHNATSEAQKLDALSVNGFAPGSNFIVEGAFRVPNNGAGSAVDVNFGVASATHATDADSIAEHLFLHIDANALSMHIQSKDGTTTVAAVDTTSDYTEGTALSTRVHFWFDCRDLTDIQCYLDGVLTLGASTFRLDNAVGPLFLLAHSEKTSAADVHEVALDWLRVRTAEQ